MKNYSHIKDKVLSGLYKNAPAIGALYGGSMGALSGSHYPDAPRLKEYAIKDNESNEQYQKRIARNKKRAETLHKRYKKEHMVGSIASGAVGGYMLGHLAKGYTNSFRNFKNYGKAGATFTKSQNFGTKAGNEFKSSIKGIKTKVDAKTAFRKASLKTHPDKGGKPEEFMDVKNIWDDFRNSSKFDKLAFLNKAYNNSFINNMEKISRDLTADEKWKIYDLKAIKGARMSFAEQALIREAPGFIGGAIGFKKGGFRGMMAGALLGSLAGSVASSAYVNLKPENVAIKKEIKDIITNAKGSVNSST